jgi:hypothetical protein
MAEERFPYEQSQWVPKSPDEQRRWFEALEKIGPENVRSRLAQVPAGSGAVISIGTEIGMTVGFAQEWLAWHDRRKAERETHFRQAQIHWTRWAAMAASIAAAAAVIGWILTIWRKW